VNILVSSLLSCVAAISSLVRFGTRKVRFVAAISSLVRFRTRKVRFVVWGLPGLDRSGRRATPA
jgi:hypothetical protein